MRAIETRHQPGSGIGKRRHHVVEITGRNENVAVVHQQNLMAGLARQFRQYARFGIRRRGGNPGDGNRQVGELALQALDVFDRRVGGIADAEQNFELGIVLRRVGSYAGVKARVAAVNGLENGDGGRIRRTLPRCRPAPPRCGDQRQQIVGGRRQRRKRKQDHSETSATPQRTTAAPAQRSQLTRSFKTYLAKAVSTT